MHVSLYFMTFPEILVMDSAPIHIFLIYLFPTVFYDDLNRIPWNSTKRNKKGGNRGIKITRK